MLNWLNLEPKSERSGVFPLEAMVLVVQNYVIQRLQKPFDSGRYVEVEQKEPDTIHIRSIGRTAQQN